MDVKRAQSKGGSVYSAYHQCVWRLEYKKNVAEDYVCVFQKFVGWNLIPNEMVLGGRALEVIRSQDGFLLNRIKFLIKEAPESSLIPSAMWRHSAHTDTEDPGHLGTRSRPSPDTEPASTLILVFPASKTVKNNFPLFIIHPCMFIIYHITVKQTKKAVIWSETEETVLPASASHIEQRVAPAVSNT